MLALLLTLSVVVQDSGAFVVKIGNDTLSLEQYTRTATQVRGEYVIRAPRSLHRIYVNDLNPDGTKFHRVIPNFMIQGGDPYSKTGKGAVGTGGPGYTIKCETSKNTHKHVAGTLSMAHAGKDTGGSQFFICHSPQRHLDGVHTVFGQVTKGMDVVNAIRGNDEIKSIRVS